jgi:hypothetical protein
LATGDRAYVASKQNWHCRWGVCRISSVHLLAKYGSIKDITVYGQESNQTTWKLSKMNLAIRNINSQFVAWNTEGSFLKDAHPDLKADYILANPYPYYKKVVSVMRQYTPPNHLPPNFYESPLRPKCRFSPRRHC